MKKEQEMFADPLTRSFVPCVRVVASEQAEGSGIFPGNKVLRSFPACDYPICTVRQGGFVLLDFGKELAGGVRIVTAGDMKPCRIRVRFGESISEAIGAPTTDHALHDMVLPLERYYSEDFGNTGFRFVRLDAQEGDMMLHNVIAIYERREYPEKGSFHSSDELLDRVWNTAVHTIKLNMQDYIYDGVKRDRLLWGGDLNPEARVILRVYGDVSVLRDTLEEFRTHTRKGCSINGFSSYSLWYFITLHDHWFHSGDDTLLQNNRELLEAELKRFASLVDAEGREMLPPCRFLDWPSHNNPDVLHAGLQPLLLWGMRVLKEMLDYLGSDTSAAVEAIAKLQRHVPDPGKSKQAAALQTLTGMADRRNVLEQNPFSGVSTFFGYYMLLAKDPFPALELVRKFWGGMLKLGATSFWEDFNLDWAPGATGVDEMPVPGRPDIHADFGAYCYKGLRHSLCHGWASGPAAWCSEKLLGVNPLAPGFRKISFTPDLCDLEFAEGSVPTPYGEIRVKLEKGKTPELSTPAGIAVEAK